MRIITKTLINMNGRDRVDRGPVPGMQNACMSGEAMGEALTGRSRHSKSTLALTEMDKEILKGRYV